MYFNSIRLFDDQMILFGNDGQLFPVNVKNHLLLSVRSFFLDKSDLN